MDDDIFDDIKKSTEIKKTKGKVKFVPRTKENQINLPDLTPFPARGPGGHLEKLDLLPEKKKMDTFEYYDDDFNTFQACGMSNASIEATLKKYQKQQHQSSCSGKDFNLEEPAKLPEIEASSSPNISQIHDNRRRRRQKKENYNKKLEKFEGVMVPCEDDDEVYVNRLRYGVTSDDVDFGLSRKGEKKTKTARERLMEVTDDDFLFEKR